MVAQDDVWKLIDLLFSRREDLYRHQFESYEYFIEKLMPYEIRNSTTIDEHEDPDNNLIYSYRFLFSNITFVPATLDGAEYMTPMIARYRHLSYFGTVIADISQIQQKVDTITGEVTTTTITEEKAVPVAKLPIMVKSRYCTTTLMPEKASEECVYDPGCYFIVNGSEKVILSVERMAPNKVFVYERKKDGDTDYRASITSQRDNVEGNGVYYGFNVYLRYKAGQGIVLTANNLHDVPVAIMLRAMGVTTDEELVKMVIQKPTEEDLEMANCLRTTLDESVDEEGKPIHDMEQAIEFLIQKTSGVRIYTQNQDVRNKQKRAFIEKLLHEDMLPHVEGDVFKKAAFLCYMMRRLLQVYLGRAKSDDRDTLVNKRIEMPGILLGQIFRQYWSKMIKECGIFFRKKNISDATPVKVINQIRPLTIEQSIKSALLTGRWGLAKAKHGIARVLERLSYNKTVTQFRKIITPSLDERNSKISSMRHVHASQMGFLCIVETPEGEKIGLDKNLSMSASITTPDLTSGVAIRSLILKHPDFIDPSDVAFEDYSSYFKVMVNGDHIAMTTQPMKIYQDILRTKLMNHISRYTSLYIDADSRELRVFTDGGRLIRPLLRVNPETLKLFLEQKHLDSIDSRGIDSKKITTWDAFLHKYPEVIEYIDVEQSPYSLIALYLSDLDDVRRIREMPAQPDALDKVNRYTNMFPLYQHCELHPSLNLGMTVSTIPFCNMNQSPRNLFQYAQAKQAVGLYCTNWMNRFDISHVLYNPQVPIVTTRATEYTGLMDLPNGENVIVAIAPYTGYNQEDSMVLNATSVARGLFWSTSLKKYNSTIEKNQVSSQDDIHMKPDRNLVSNIRADVNYDKLSDNGFVPEETKISNGDAIIGKVSPIQASERTSKIFKDKSEVYKGYHQATVDKVITGVLNGEGYEMIQMRVRSERIPQIGDKFSSRSGQKCTCGILLRQEEMPFTENGIVPDLIINPNCIPSRMTIGQLLECVLSKIGALKGELQDGTAFERRDIDKICDDLEALGFNRHGYETMYSGATGKKMEAMMFIGPTYYQRLKHLVADKIHARASGPTVMMTRQPPDGRTKNGGLRFGTMERDGAIAHGIACFLKERMMETSDKYSMHVCDRCGLLASKVKNHTGYFCKACDNTVDVSLIHVPYCFKLFMQELMAIGVVPRLRTNKTELIGSRS